MADLLPAAVAVAEAFGDLAEAELFPAEAAAIASATERRRREFATGRACARTALARLGVPPAAILPGTRGAPQWPEGVVGSITHCAGYRASAVAFGREVAAIGLDAEPNEPLPGGVLRAVAGEAEQAGITALAADRPDVAWDRLLFSAKESVYKAWFPLTGGRLRFRDAMVEFDPEAGTFSAELLMNGPVVDGVRLTELDGRWVAADGLVTTAIVVPRRGAG
jgi:4'-phosphopantetheinyl transferase EntD